MFAVERNTCLGMPKYHLFSFLSNVYLYKSLNLRLSRIVDIERESRTNADCFQMLPILALCNNHVDFLNLNLSSKRIFKGYC